jgi:phosphinothricin acetyltransferase
LNHYQLPSSKKTLVLAALHDIVIRNGRETDLPRLVEIYNYYVLNGHVTFDTELATVESRRPWFEAFSTGPHQILVAEGSQGLLGCATSSPYRTHAAFDQTVETGIYLNPSARGKGVGTQLYAALLGVLESQPVHLAVAGVALPNDASVALHRKLGFEEVGVFCEYAIKRDVRISSMWFQRPIRSTQTGKEQTA